MCNSCIKLKMFSISLGFVEVTHFYNMKSCFHSTFVESRKETAAYQKCVDPLLSKCAFD